MESPKKPLNDSEEEKRKKLSKNFYFLSIIPAFAYWYLEENYSIEIALYGGVGLAVLEIALEFFFTKKVHTISKFNLFLISALGGISLVFKDGIWFKLQPCFTGVGIGAFLVIRSLSGKGLLLEMMEEIQGQTLPEPIMKPMEIHFGLFFFAYGIFMAFIAIYATSGQWLFFKTGGFYIAFAVFAIIEMILIKKKVKKLHERVNYAHSILKSSSPKDQ